jgi:hypothetical protein
MATRKHKKSRCTVVEYQGFVETDNPEIDNPEPLVSVAEAFTIFRRTNGAIAQSHTSQFVSLSTLVPEASTSQPTTISFSSVPHQTYGFIESQDTGVDEFMESQDMGIDDGAAEVEVDAVEEDVSYTFVFVFCLLTGRSVRYH